MFLHIKKREYLQSGASIKVLIYATNQELPCQTFNEKAVHFITQDYNPIKTKIIKHVLDQKQRLGETDQHQTHSIYSSPLTTRSPHYCWSHRRVVLSQCRCTQPQGLFWFLFIVWLVISPKFRFQNFDGFGLFFGYQSVRIGKGFIDLVWILLFFWALIVFSWVLVGHKQSPRN